MRGRAVIVGVGNTSYGRHPGRDKVDLIVEAAGKAIADAGIAKDEIDGVFVKIANAAPTERFSRMPIKLAMGAMFTTRCSRHA